jgi:hypothetical protein
MGVLHRLVVAIVASWPRLAMILNLRGCLREAVAAQIARAIGQAGLDVGRAAI